jgi:antitoxin ParD1/3/4
MNVSLSNEMKSWIHQKVASGLYQSANEVVREALRLLVEREQLQQLRAAELRREIAIGLSELEDGRSRPFDNSVVLDIKKKGRTRSA